MKLILFIASCSLAVMWPLALGNAAVFGAVAAILEVAK